MLWNSSVRATLAGSALFVVASLSGCSATNPGNAPKRIAPPTLQTGSPPRTAPRQTPRPPVAKRDITRFTVSLGRRSMDDEVAWDRLENPFMLGFEGDYRAADSPLGAEYGLLIAADSDEVAGIDITSTFLELYGGVRLTGDIGSAKRLHPYIGAGVTLIFADVTTSFGFTENSDDDLTLGGYVRGGIYYDINRRFSIGVDGRVVYGTDIRLAGINSDADYEQLALVFGWGF